MRQGTKYSVWFGWATVPDLVGTRQECEAYVAHKMLSNREYADRLTVEPHRTVANEHKEGGSTH